MLDDVYPSSAPPFLLPVGPTAPGKLAHKARFTANTSLLSSGKLPQMEVCPGSRRTMISRWVESGTGASHPFLLPPTEEL